MGRRVCLHRPDYGFTARRGQMEAEVSPPSCALIYTHTHLATSFSQDNYLATSASPHSLTHLHAHTLHQLWTLTRNDNRHTHIKTCQGVCIYTHSTSPPALGGKKWQLVVLMKDTAASCSFANPTDRQTETLSYIFGIDDFFFRCSVCLFA